MSHLQLSAALLAGLLGGIVRGESPLAPIMVESTRTAVSIGHQPGRPRFEGTNQPALDSFWEIQRAHRIDPSVFARLKTEIPQQRLPGQMVAVFTEPAHFPRYAVDRAMQPFADDAAIIYEGMRIEVDREGRFEVSLSIEIPRTVVVIRLQLQVFEEVDGMELSRGTITLPPLTLKHEPDVSRHQASHSFLVRRTGYSHLLRGIDADEFADYRITRSGTAMFGDRPEKGKYFAVSSNGE